MTIKAIAYWLAAWALVFQRKSSNQFASEHGFVPWRRWQCTYKQLSVMVIMPSWEGRNEPTNERVSICGKYSTYHWWLGLFFLHTRTYTYVSIYRKLKFWYLVWKNRHLASNSCGEKRNQSIKWNIYCTTALFYFNCDLISILWNLSTGNRNVNISLCAVDFFLREFYIATSRKLTMFFSEAYLGRFFFPSNVCLRKKGRN